MKVISLFILCILFSGCNFSEGGTGSFNGNIQSEQLLGSWLGVKVINESNETAAQPAPDDIVKELEERFILMPVAFQKENIFIGGENEQHHLINSNWELFDAGIISIREGRELFFTIKAMNDSSMLLETQLGSRKKSHKVQIRLSRIDPEKYDGKDIFSAALNSWRQKPATVETLPQIKARLISLLRFDDVYIRAIYHSSSTVVNTKKLLLPFIYYNGGLGLAAFDAKTDFASLFYNAENAAQAQRILSDACKKVTYPARDNYLLEYADFIKQVATMIEKSINQP